MIIYDPFWETLRRKKITTYALIKGGFSRGTLDSLKQGRPINTTTLDDICELLDCEVEDVLKHIKE